MPELPIYFIRHNFNGIEESAQVLAANSFIGYHFADEFFERKEDYKNLHIGHEKGFSKAFDGFTRLGKSGGIAVFEYDDSDVFRIAKVDGEQRVGRFDFAHSGDGVYVYKVLRYQNVRTFNYADHPVLLALRPPYGTICRPGEHFQRIILYLYFERDLPKTVNLLHPKVLEQLCENYLRSDFVPAPLRIQYTIMKTGKTLPIVDIVGRSVTGKRLLVQITHHAGLPALAKARELVKVRKDSPEATAIFFSADSDMTIDGLDAHFPISNVFNTFNNSPDPWHRSMITEMLGITLNKDAVNKWTS